MQKRVFWMLVIFCCFLLSAPACAAEIWVGEGDYPSLTEAVAVARPGDTLRLRAGVYGEPAEVFPILIDKPLTIQGEAGAVLDAPAFKPALEVTAADVTLENIDFQFRRWGVLGLADRLTVTNCRFTLADETYRVSSCGIWLAGVYDCAITNCDFTGCGLCIAGPPLSERSKTMPVLTGLFEVGEDTALFTSHRVEENRVNGKPLYYYRNEKDVVIPQDAGMAIVVCSENVTVQGLDVSDSSMGLEIVHCSNVTVRDVTADRAGIFGIYLAYVDGGRLERVTTRNANHGIDLRDVQSMTVADCDAIDCEQGIFLSWAFDCIVDRCEMLRCGNGFFIAAGQRNQLSRSVADGNENGFYLQNEEDMLVWNNSVARNTVAGIRVLKSSGQLIDNDVHENWVGVLAAENKSLTVTGNAFVRNESACLYLRDVTSGKISQNRFEGETKAFLELDGILEKTLICENLFAGGMDKVVSSVLQLPELGHNDWQSQ